jgi:hypothetical protein
MMGFDVSQLLYKDYVPLFLSPKLSHAQFLHPMRTFKIRLFRTLFRETTKYFSLLVFSYSAISCVNVGDIFLTLSFLINAG